MAKAKKKAAKKTKAKSTAKKAPAKLATKKTAVKKATAKTAAKKITAKPQKKAAAKTKTSNKSKTTAKSTMSWKNFITPLDDRLIVQLTSAEKKTPGGLFIPETAAVSGHLEGKVLVVGRGHRNSKGVLRPMDVKEGNLILFSEHAGSKMNLLGMDVHILRESEVLGILE